MHNDNQPYLSGWLSKSLANRAIKDEGQLACSQTLLGPRLLTTLAFLYFIWGLVGCGGITESVPDANSSQDLLSWNTMVSSARQAAMDTEEHVEVYDVMVTTVGVQPMAENIGTLEYDFHFIAPSKTLTRIVLKEASPMSTPTITAVQENVGQGFAEQEYYAKAAAEVKIGPREVQRRIWPEVPSHLQATELWPIFYLDLNHVPSVWHVQYVSKDNKYNTQSSSSGLPTNLLSSTYAAGFVVKAQTGEILQRDYQGLQRPSDTGRP